MTAIRMWLSLQATEYHTQKVQMHAPNRNCEPSNSSVKQSIGYITHGPIHCIWMCWTPAAHHVLCRTHGKRCSLHQAGMDKMKHFCRTYFSPCTSPPPPSWKVTHSLYGCCCSKTNITKQWQKYSFSQYQLLHVHVVVRQRTQGFRI